MNLRTAAHLFDGLSNHIEAEPTTIRLSEDRVLIRDIEDAPMEGKIAIPANAQSRGVGKNGLLRTGIVVAVGPGNKFREVGLDTQGNVRRKLITGPCQTCTTGRYFDARAYEFVACPSCHGSRRVPQVIPTECRPGDRVVYDRRKEAEFYINGERFSLVYEEQSVFMIL